MVKVNRCLEGLLGEGEMPDHRYLLARDVGGVGVEDHAPVDALPGGDETVRLGGFRAAVPGVDGGLPDGGFGQVPAADQARGLAQRDAVEGDPGEDVGAGLDVHGPRHADATRRVDHPGPLGADVHRGQSHLLRDRVGQGVVDLPGVWHVVLRLAKVRLTRWRVHGRFRRQNPLASSS